MAVSDVIRIGDKIDVRLVQQIENNDKSGETPEVYRSQVLDIKENGNFEIAMPTEKGRLILLPLGVRFEFVLASPEVLLVSTPDPSSLTDSYSLLKALYHHPDFAQNQSQIYVVANRVAGADEGRQLFEKLDSVVKQFLAGKIQYLGAVPQDVALEKAVRQQKPVSLSNPNSKSAEAFAHIAKAIMNEEDAVASTKWGISKLINKFMNR